MERVKKSGIFQEYKIAQDYGNYVVPVRSTGFAAKRIYDDLRSKKSCLTILNF